jgi:nucleotide-binding universal stress UspA family protein
MARLSNVPVRPVIRASHSLSKGIVHAAQDESCNLVVMGYAGRPNTGGQHLMEEVLQFSGTDIIFLKLKDMTQDFQPRKIAVSLGGRANLPLMVALAGSLASRFEGELTFLNILPQRYTQKQRQYTDGTIIEAIEKHRSEALYQVRVLASANPQQTLIKASADYDLLIVGTTKVRFTERATVGNFASQVAEQAHCPVAIVRVVSGAQKFMKKL